MRKNIYLLVFIFIFQILAYAPAQSMSNDEFVGLCTTGTLEEVKKAIKAGADVNAKHKNGYTPLMVGAINNKKPAVISELIKAGADVNAKNNDGLTALMAGAMLSKNPTVIAELIKAGADLNAKNNDGFTALMLGVINNESPAVITELIKAGADVKTKDKNRTAVIMLSLSVFLTSGEEAIWPTPAIGMATIESCNQYVKSHGDSIIGDFVVRGKKNAKLKNNIDFNQPIELFCEEQNGK